MLIDLPTAELGAHYIRLMIRRMLLVVCWIYLSRLSEYYCLNFLIVKNFGIFIKQNFTGIRCKRANHVIVFATKFDPVVLSDMHLQSKIHLMPMSVIAWVSYSSASKGMLPFHLFSSTDFYLLLRTMSEQRFHVTCTIMQASDLLTHLRVFVFLLFPYFHSALLISCQSYCRDLTVFWSCAHDQISQCDF